MKCNAYRILPSNTAAHRITNLNKSHYTEPWPYWKRIPPTFSELLFYEFMVSFKTFVIMCKFDIYRLICFI